MHATFAQPKRDKEIQVDQELLPAYMKRGPAIYLHTDTGWDCLCVDVENDEWEWLPLLQRIEAVDGVGGVTYNKQTKRFNFTGAIQGHASLKTRSAPILPSDPRLGQWRNYDRNFFDCENDGKRYVDPGEQYERLPNGDVMTSSDAKEWQAFLRNLKTAEIVPPMPAVVFRAMRNRVQHRLDQHRRNEKDRSAEQAQKELARMDKAWARETAKARDGAKPVTNRRADHEGGIDGLDDLNGPPQPRRVD